MDVYIEYVIIDNFVLTYCICALSHRLIRTRGRFWRDALAAVVGTAVAVLYPFIGNVYVTLAVKIALCAVMTLICYPPKRFLRGATSILLATFLFGGVTFCIGYIRYGDVQRALTLPATGLPLGAVVGVGLVVLYLFRRLATKRHKIADCVDFTGRMDIAYNGFRVTCTAFLDSGNRVCDTVTGLPVVVLGMRVGMKLLTDEQLSQVMLGKPVAGGRFETFRTAAGQGKILLVKPQKITLYVMDKENILDNVMLGLSFSRFHDAEEYDAILSPTVLQT